MVRRRRLSKGVRKRRRAMKVLLAGILLLSLLLLSIPYVKHINAYRSAIDRYDFNTLSQELAWIENKGKWLKKIPLVQEGELWLRLNQGDYENLEGELAQYEDDAHRFWLFQLYLLKAQPNNAEEVIQSFGSPALKRFSEGLLWADNEEHEKAVSTLLTISDSDLNSEERVLKSITLARSYMALGNLEQAQKSWQIAANLSSKHPMVVDTEYNLALSTGQWGRAKELSSQIIAPKDSPYTQQLLVKKALLALVVGDRGSYQDSLEELGKMEKGEACVNYLTGLEVYERGEFQHAVEYLQRAIDIGVPRFLENDATTALALAKERVEAEAAIKQVIGY